MPYVAPPELEELLCNVFYKHSAPLALQNQGIRQQYPRFGSQQDQSFADLMSSFLVAGCSLSYADH